MWKLQWIFFFLKARFTSVLTRRNDFSTYMKNVEETDQQNEREHVRIVGQTFYRTVRKATLEGNEEPEETHGRLELKERSCQPVR